MGGIDVEIYKKNINLLKRRRQREKKAKACWLPEAEIVKTLKQQRTSLK